VFFDNILIYNSSFDQHIYHLKTTFEVLRFNQLYIKESKCAFTQEQVEYLGHIISKTGMSTDPSKVAAMLDWRPTSVKGLRGFLGLTSYYYRFVKNYGIISRFLTELLKKDGFHWSLEAKKAFAALTEAVSNVPTLGLPNFSKPFILETNACASRIGVVLVQEGRPLAFF